MDTKQFLAEFEHIANAIGGVKRLREMIYNLAVTGNLPFPKIDEVDDARELLKRITSEKNKRIRDKQFKRTPKFEKAVAKPPSNIELPKHWVWTNLASIGEISPKNEVEDSLDASFIPMSGVSQLHSGELILERRKWGNIKKGYTQFADGDVVIAKITPCFENGKSGVIKGLSNRVGAGTTELHVIRPLPGVNPRYIYIFLRSPYFMVEGEMNMTGTAGQKRLTSKYFATRPFPLPPIEEQVWIVKKVDDLMDLCDKLEEQLHKKRTLQNQLRQATLQAVATATSPFELKQHWQRLQTNFEQLFATPNDVEEFSAHIKELAVQGLLTLNKKYRPDITSIKAACSELKESYISKKLMRKQKPVSIAECSVIYPKNWELQAFDEIAIVIGGVTKGRKIQGRTLVNCPYLAVANVQRGFFKLSKVKTIDIPVDELEKYIVQENDLLITEGGDWDKVGRTAIWKENIENCIHQNHIFKARLPSEKVLNSWVELVFNSNVGRDYFAGASKQTTNLASINMTQLRSFPFPIPPIEQQIEILQVVESLEKICQSWRKKYKRLNELSSLLASTSVSALTGIDAPKEEESLKTPTTELVAPISLGQNKPTSNDSAPLSTILVKQNGKINANDLWQRFGGEIDAFYSQLKTEINHGWIEEPSNAEMLEKDPE
jgi:type I restriction enzyme, S subunit